MQNGNPLTDMLLNNGYMEKDQEKLQAGEKKEDIIQEEYVEEVTSTIKDFIDQEDEIDKDLEQDLDAFTEEIVNEQNNDDEVSEKVFRDSSTARDKENSSEESVVGDYDDDDLLGYFDETINNTDTETVEAIEDVVVMDETSSLDEVSEEIEHQEESLDAGIKKTNKKTLLYLGLAFLTVVIAGALFYYKDNIMEYIQPSTQEEVADKDTSDGVSLSESTKLLQVKMQTSFPFFSVKTSEYKTLYAYLQSTKSTKLIETFVKVNDGTLNKHIAVKTRFFGKKPDAEKIIKAMNLTGVAGDNAVKIIANAYKSITGKDILDPDGAKVTDKEQMKAILIDKVKNNKVFADKLSNELTLTAKKFNKYGALTLIHPETREEVMLVQYLYKYRANMEKVGGSEGVVYLDKLVAIHEVTGGTLEKEKAILKQMFTVLKDSSYIKSIKGKTTQEIAKLEKSNSNIKKAKHLYYLTAFYYRYIDYISLQ